ncbi:MAG: orotidine-5'-phosphate decarboxylase [Saprospiraceae bacterium]
MTRVELFEQIIARQSFLCVGLDTDLNRIPKHLLELEDPIFEFNKRIIDATSDLCVAYKPNTAFYESMGARGWEALKKTIDYIPKGHLIIADAKRGDIGNTSKMYAKAFFEDLSADAITVAPYMGSDSVKPFLDFENKWVILLALTSNGGSQDFQMETLGNDGVPLYEKVMRKAQEWGSTDQLMYVVGATHPKKFEDIRRIAPEHFLLVPGVGAQGGDLEQLCHYGLNDECGLLVNSSRGIIYAGSDSDFAEKARASALKLQQQMATILKERFSTVMV